MNMMLPSPFEHVSPSPYSISDGNKKSRKSIDKEKEVVEQGMKDVIEKVADIIKPSKQLIVENIRTSSEIIVKKAPITLMETYQILLDLGFQLPLLHNIYTKLIMNMDLLNAILGCPMEHRKDFILSGALDDLNSFNT